MIKKLFKKYRLQKTQLDYVSKMVGELKEDMYLSNNSVDNLYNLLDKIQDIKMVLNEEI